MKYSFSPVLVVLAFSFAFSSVVFAQSPSSGSGVRSGVPIPSYFEAKTREAQSQGWMAGMGDKSPRRASSLAPLPVTTGGILPKVGSLYEESGVLGAAQLFSPFAPSSLGYGKGMVQINAKGKPKGFVVASIRFW
jgi:hypothetical protein